MRYVRSLLMGAALSVLVASPVAGDWGPITATGGSNFATTASVSLAYIETDCGFSGLEKCYSVEIIVGNEGLGEVFAAVGLMNLPSGWVATGTATAFDRDGTGFVDEFPIQWDTKSNAELVGDDLLENTFAFIAPPSPVVNGLQQGQAGKFLFALVFDITKYDGKSDYVPLFENLDLGIGIHAISSDGPVDCSTKLGIMNIEGGVIGPHSNPDNWDPRCTPTVVPEPSTVVLLGTGLVGLAGVAWRRRKEDEE